MSPKTKWIITAIVVVVIGTPIAIDALNQPSDQVLIKQALDEAVKAGREGRPSVVLEHISSRFQVNDEGTRPNRRSMADYIRKYKPSVEIMKLQPVISGDKALVISPVRISFLTQGMVVPEVTMELEKEDSFKWLIVPAKKWRLVRVDISDAVVSEIEAQYQLLGGGL